MIFRAVFFLIFLVGTFISAVSVQLPKDTINVGYEQTASVIVSNPSDEFKAVEVFVKSRAYDIHGEELLEDTDDFFIIPSQFIINAQEEQVVTLQWIGGSALSYETPYRIIVQEVPLNQISQSFETTTNASVQIRLRFVNSFYVVNKKVAPNVVVNNISILGQKMMCEFENIGDKHFILTGFDLDIFKDDQKDSVIISAETLKESFNLLPKEKRLIEFDIPSFVSTDNTSFMIHSLY